MKLRLLLILAAIGILLGVFIVIKGAKKPPVPPIEFPPPSSPFKYFVAGSGLIEAQSENTAIGTPLSGIVKKVFVEAGDDVNQDCPLFEIDTSYLHGQLQEAKTNYQISLANLEKELALPRPEEVPPQESLVKQAEARLQNAETEFALYENVTQREAISQNEYNQKRFAVIEAKHQLKEAQERLELLVAGTWSKDIDIYKAEVENAIAKIKTIEIDIARSIIRAPYPGRVLQVNIHEGEFAQSIFDQTNPYLLFGNVQNYAIRIDIDEDDAWRVKKEAPGIAFVRGNSRINFPIEFVRIEPYLIPKQALTGSNFERVDTRVLQVIYIFKPENFPVYPGQIMDVFLEAEPNP